MKTARRKGPIATINEHGATVRIYESDGVYTLAYYKGRERKLERRSELGAAKARAREILQSLSSGVAHVRTFSAQEAAVVDAAIESLRDIGVPMSIACREYGEAHKILANTGISIVEAARAAAAAAGAAKLKPITVSDVVTEFIKSREKGGASTRYIEDIRSRLTQFSKAFRCNIGSVSAGELGLFLDRLKVGPRTRNNTRATVATLFGYAKRQGYLARDRQTEAELVDAVKEAPTKIGIYPPKTFAKMLAGLPETMLPAAAIGGLAGLRSAEIFRLEWSDMKLDQGHIVVQAENAKTASRRIVPIVPALNAWLVTVSNRKGRVVKGYSRESPFTRAMTRCIDAAGVEPIHNGLRHSFASYRLAVVKSADQVALEMGNSPRKIFTNYRELVTEKEAAAYFEINPTAQRSVIAA